MNFEFVPSKSPNFTWNGPTGSTNRKVQDAEILVVKIYIGTSDTLARAQDLLPIKWAMISFNLDKSSRISPLLYSRSLSEHYYSPNLLIRQEIHVYV